MKTPTIDRMKCELRPGIGLCDSCLLPKWPQEYVGNGDMICLDCIREFNQKAADALKRRGTNKIKGTK